MDTGEKELLGLNMFLWKALKLLRSLVVDGCFLVSGCLLKSEEPAFM